MARHRSGKKVSSNAKKARRKKPSPKRKSSKRKPPKRKSSKRKSSKRKPPKRKSSKRKPPKRKSSKRKTSKRKPSKRKSSKRKPSPRRKKRATSKTLPSHVKKQYIAAKKKKQAPKSQKSLIAGQCTNQPSENRCKRAVNCSWTKKGCRRQTGIYSLQAAQKRERKRSVDASKLLKSQLAYEARKKKTPSKKLEKMVKTMKSPAKQNIFLKSILGRLGGMKCKKHTHVDVCNKSKYCHWTGVKCIPKRKKSKGDKGRQGGRGDIGKADRGIIDDVGTSTGDKGKPARKSPAKKGSPAKDIALKDAELAVPANAAANAKKQEQKRAASSIKDAGSAVKASKKQNLAKQKAREQLKQKSKVLREKLARKGVKEGKNLKPGDIQISKVNGKDLANIFNKSPLSSAKTPIKKKPQKKLTKCIGLFKNKKACDDSKRL